LTAEELDRILSREAILPEKGLLPDRLKIGITGISSGAGASFLAGCLARYLANTGKHNPAVIESERASLFDSYGMDKRFAGRSYHQIYRALEENRSIRGACNMDEGINWILRSPGEEKIRLSFEQKLRLCSQAVCDTALCDLSGEEKDFQLLQSMDQIIVIIDPMPSKMLQGYHILNKLKTIEEKNSPVIYVINKMNRGVNRRQMLDYLKLKKPVFLPLINPESIYNAEYNCKIPYSVGEVRRILQPALEEVVSRLIF
jgi:hypothetical protein